MAGQVQITYGKPRGADVYGSKRWLAKAGGVTGQGPTPEAALYDLAENLLSELRAQ